MGYINRKELSPMDTHGGCRADGSSCGAVDCHVGNRIIFRSPKGDQAYVVRQDDGKMTYFNNHDVVVPDLAKTGLICLTGRVEDFLTAPLLPETLFPFPGEVIDFKRVPSILMTSQRGKAWDLRETCINCWYNGERTLLTGSSRVKIGHMGRSRHQVLPTDVALSVVDGIICLAGLRNIEEAVKAAPLEAPKTSRCFQQTNRNPLTEVDDG